MGEYAMEQAFRTYGYGSVRTEIHTFASVDCPVCGKSCGGKSGSGGEQGRLEGVHQHMKFKHGILKKWKRVEMLTHSKERDQ